MPHRNQIDIQANWGDCDAAGIIFYPNYFRWFDECTQALLRSVGLSQRSLRDEFGIVGTAAVDASARFTAPVSYGDVLRASSHVERWGTSSFTVYHRFERSAEVLAVEGREVRIWAKLEPDGRLRTEPIPEAFRRLFA
ncbi:MAG: thioesterase family protein [Immundisolibacterales bacterium]|nr:thioesterase family protein [Immundisolibacterales bacterium]